jgi:uncharacterized SAM-binding protein YcdF (DUF218 family)
MAPNEPAKDVKISTCRVLGLVGVVLFLAFAYTPLPNLLAQRLATPSRLEKAEAIVVLGSNVSENGVLESDSLRRAIQGIVLQRKGLAPLLVLSGTAPKKGLTEAKVRAELAREIGISSDAILTEEGARTTREEAIRIGALLRARQVRRVLLVTSPYHMLRAQRLFERAGFEVLPATAEDTSQAANSPEGRLRLTREVLQEILARLYYRVAGYL